MQCSGIQIKCLAIDCLVIECFLHWNILSLILSFEKLNADNKQV